MLNQVERKIRYSIIKWNFKDFYAAEQTSETFPFVEDEIFSPTKMSKTFTEDFQFLPLSNDVSFNSTCFTIKILSIKALEGAITTLFVDS